MNKRVFENPLIKDKVTLLESSTQTGGAYTLLEVELQAGGGNDLHYHLSFSEQFTVVNGELGIDLNKQQLRLQKGESATAPAKELHRFYNPGDKPVTFLVKLVPGHERFEQGLAIAYGLAADGKTTKNGVPRKLDHMSLVVSFTDTCLPGFFSFIQPVMRWRARRDMRKNMQLELIRKYC